MTKEQKVEAVTKKLDGKEVCINCGEEINPAGIGGEASTFYRHANGYYSCRKDGKPPLAQVRA